MERYYEIPVNGGKIGIHAISLELATAKASKSHAVGNGRKHADSYLERLRAANWRGGAAYFRQFARRGASALDY